MNDFWYNWTGPIVASCGLFAFLTLCYFVARERPEFSRSMHKKNCSCKICYPSTTGDSK